ncbi:hypothetical protein ACR9GP_22770 [Enterobacter ludwigii]
MLTFFERGSEMLRGMTTLLNTLPLSMLYIMPESIDMNLTVTMVISGLGAAYFADLRPIRGRSDPAESASSRQRLLYSEASCKGCEERISTQE